MARVASAVHSSFVLRHDLPDIGWRGQVRRVSHGFRHPARLPIVAATVRRGRRYLILLRRLAHALPDALARACADDVAVALPAGLQASQFLEPMFEEYARVSGLKLHRGKSHWVPLCPVDVEAERARLREVAPSWGDFSISFSATYFGLVCNRDGAEGAVADEGASQVR